MGILKAVNKPENKPVSRSDKKTVHRPENNQLAESRPVNKPVSQLDKKYG